MKEIPSAFALNQKSERREKQYASQIEIFNVGTDKHIATCYNPYIYPTRNSLDEYNRTKTWCATANIYDTILNERDARNPIDIGIVPCKYIIA